MVTRLVGSALRRRIAGAAAEAEATPPQCIYRVAAAGWAYEPCVGLGLCE